MISLREVPTEESTEEGGAEEGKIKPFDLVVETVLKLKKNPVGVTGTVKGLAPDSISEGLLRLFFAAMVLTLCGIAVLSFFLTREFSKHQQTRFELGQVEQARSRLEQSLAQLRSEMAEQQKRIEKLGVELEKTSAKAALLDQVRRDHESERARVQALYEAQLADLRKLLEGREAFVNRLQSRMESMRSVVQQEGYGFAFPASRPLTKTPTDSPAVPLEETQGHKRISGKVALVDRENRFIIVTFGAVDGAVVGDFIKIYQGGAPLGEGRIERVYHHLSAAAIVSEDTLTHVQKGDSVFLALF
jgi:hypothetical protein